MHYQWAMYVSLSFIVYAYFVQLAFYQLNSLYPQQAYVHSFWGAAFPRPSASEIQFWDYISQN